MLLTATLAEKWENNALKLKKNTKYRDNSLISGKAKFNELCYFEHILESIYCIFFSFYFLQKKGFD